MTKKELAEIKRRFTLDHNNITCIRGCYVNSQGEVISAFSRSLVGMPQEEAEKYLTIFKRTLSGEREQNLLTIDFTPEQVMDGAEHHLLMRLRDCALKEDEIVEQFLEKARSSFTLEENEHYLILLMHDGYDVPYKTHDDASAPDLSTEVFHYILCSVCPVKLTKPALAYNAGENDFRSKEADWVVGMPEMGFMFPAFEERAANIYTAVYYTRDTAQTHEPFIQAVFGAQPPVPAAAQKEAFQSVLQEALGEECSYEVLQTVHAQVMDKVEEQKKDKSAAEPPRIDKREVRAALEECGVTLARQEAFEEKFDEEFGQSAALTAANVSSPKQFEVRTPHVVIKVAPDRSDLVETRLIDGLPYILIRAEEGVEVNGVSVNI